MTESAKDSALESIQLNVAKYGFHIYLVAGEAIPRFAYTIGISEVIGAELILAGASFFFAEDVKHILNAVATDLRAQPSLQYLHLQVGCLGSFSIRRAHSSWATALMLGALDYYGEKDIPAWQVVPDQDHWTLDIPDLGQPWSASNEPCWRWLHEPWKFSVPAQSVATTNLGALRGERITEAARWEADQWELFAGAGPDVPPGDVRVVPLGTLLAIDDSLAVVTTLKVGSAVWRDTSAGEWQPWG